VGVLGAIFNLPGVMDWDSEIRLSGSTRMIPIRGLSMSAMSKTDIDTMIGNTRSRRHSISKSLRFVTGCDDVTRGQRDVVTSDVIGQSCRAAEVFQPRVGICRLALS
jgi:hypothetical protein